MLHKNGGREASSSGNKKVVTAPMNSTQFFSLQPHHPKIIDPPFLNDNLQPNFVSTGLRLSSGEEQSRNYNSHLHHRLRHNQQQQQQENRVSSSSETIGSQLKRQHEDLEGFLQAQGEELRRKLAKKRQTHYRAVVSAVEQRLAQKLSEKEAEVERVMRRQQELEARVAQLTMEAESWRQSAMAHEATATQLQQAIRGAEAQDAQATEDEESAYVDPGRGAACQRCWVGMRRW